MAKTTASLFIAMLVTLLVAACSLLPAPATEPVERYLLEYTPATVQPPLESRPVLLVTIPDANGAYDSTRMAYMRQQYGLRYYVNSRWADTPANMLAPLLSESINASGRIQAVVSGFGPVSAGLRLDSMLTRFYQDFTVHPSVMHVTLRVQLVDLHDQHVLASRTFDSSEPAPGEDAYGGVQAANRVVATLLQQVTQFCVEHVH